MLGDPSVHWLEAVHEAAHAVAGLVRGFDVHVVTILGEPGQAVAAGGCLIEGPGKNPAVPLLAGPMAYARAAAAHPELLDDDEMDEDFDDWELVAALGGGISDYEKAKEVVGREGVAGAEAEARRLVEEHWGAIERVATVLERFGTIDGDQVRELIEAAGVCALCSRPLGPDDPADMHDGCERARKALVEEQGR